MLRSGHTTRILGLLLPMIILGPATVVDTAGSPGVSQSRPEARVVLVGDSTVTTKSGWGHGFALLLDEQVEVINEAVGGRSSRSYINEGRWKAALDRRGDYYLIQFGHNDQPGKGPDRETDPATSYREFMSRYVDDVRAIGATPVLVTSMVRRNFEDGRIVSTLTPYVDAVRRLAAEKQVALIDLHASSLALAERLGPAAWGSLSPRTESGDEDRTHLNAKGSLTVAPLVIRELAERIPKLRNYVRTDPLTGAAALLRLADAVVAADGSAAYRSIQDAVNASPQNSSIDRPWTIFIRRGTYRELVYIQREKRFLSLIGEDAMGTTITFDLHAKMTGLDGKPIGTFRTPTVIVDADDFTAENLTVENSAGPVGQALALRVDGDRAVFRNARFLGWQDTVFLNRGRQYFDGCVIAGHVDFIFGGATAYFERCNIEVRRDGYITAAATPAEAPYGFVFNDARITGAAGARTYLGRPWRDFAAVAFVRSWMGEVVRPEGWHNWDRPERERTSRFVETGSSGPGAAAGRRVGWAKPVSEASALTASHVLAGNDGWNPERLPARPCGVVVANR